MKLPPKVTRQLREQFGLDEEVFRSGGLNSVVRRRLEATGLDDLEDYYRLLEQSHQEFLAFADELLVPESWFFRDGKPFVWLAQWVRQVWRKQYPNTQLRILSVPCAGGQEPYSIAMTLFKEGFTPPSFHIESGDLSERFVGEAQAGIYRQIAFRGDVAKPYAEFFEDAGDGKTRVREIVRKQVAFRQRNLLAPDFLMNESPFHVIFCRNVLIYFSPCARERVVTGLTRGLAPGGVIFAGHADGLGAICQNLQPTGPGGAFCFQRREINSAGSAKVSAYRDRGRADRLDPQFHTTTSNTANRLPSTPQKQFTPLHKPRENEATGEVLTSPKPTTDELWEEVRSLANAGRLKEAEKIASGLISQASPNADAFCTLGEIYTALRRYKEAEPLFRRAVYLNARHTQSLSHLALLAERRGDRAGAERLRKRARSAEESEAKA